jgi:putative transposase
MKNKRKYNKTKKARNRINEIVDIGNLIRNNNAKMWIPTINNIKTNKMYTNSWYDMIMHENKNKSKSLSFENGINTTSELIKCKKIEIYPNKEQKYILIKWMNAYMKMYNETNKFIKKNIYNANNENIINFRVLRTQFMKNMKNNIIKKTDTPSHILDGAISDVCTSYKSCLTKVKQKDIKHFRIRYQKLSKLKKNIKLEKCYFSKNGSICPRQLGKYISTQNNYDLSKINSDCRLQYNYRNNKFVLYVPYIVETVSENQKNDYISIDPGIRTFLTGYSSNKVVEIGTNLGKKVTQYLHKIDNVSKNGNKQQIKKVKYRCYQKIDNNITDLHWKSIKYLTNNFSHIMIGKLSTKSIAESKTLNKMVKRIGHMMNFYKYLEKLKFKCKERNVNLTEVNERYTSKLCSVCGVYNFNLGAKKIFECDVCNTIIDRDVNGARNILIKSL